MVREGDRTLSSIALLQERFRQLERMKELRQEKKLLRVLSESERCSPPTINNYRLLSKQYPGSSETTFVPDDPKPHCQLSLSLWPDSRIRHADARGKTANSNNIAKSAWISNASLGWSSSSIGKNMEDYSAASDIDTSLRL